MNKFELSNDIEKINSLIREAKYDWSDYHMISDDDWDRYYKEKINAKLLEWKFR